MLTLLMNPVYATQHISVIQLPAPNTQHTTELYSQLAGKLR